MFAHGHGEFVHFLPNDRFADGEALGGEVKAFLTELLILAGLLKVGGDHGLGVCLGLGGGKPQFGCGPRPEQLIAPQRGFAPQLLGQAPSVRGSEGFIVHPATRDNQLI
jgi:hypothetical protein